MITSLSISVSHTRRAASRAPAGRRRRRAAVPWPSRACLPAQSSRCRRESRLADALKATGAGAGGCARCAVRRAAPAERCRRRPSGGGQARSLASPPPSLTEIAEGAAAQRAALRRGVADPSCGGGGPRLTARRRGGRGGGISEPVVGAFAQGVLLCSPSCNVDRSSVAPPPRHAAVTTRLIVLEIVSIPIDRLFFSEQRTALLQFPVLRDSETNEIIPLSMDSNLFHGFSSNAYLQSKSAPHKSLFQRLGEFQEAVLLQCTSFPLIWRKSRYETLQKRKTFL